MADNDFEIESIGHVYAQALVNLAQKANALPEVTEDVHSLRELVEKNETFARFLAAVTIQEYKKIASLKKLLGGRIHALTLETLNAMARRERLIYINGLFMAFDQILDRLAGKVDVELTSAQEVTPAVRQRIDAALNKALGKSPEIAVSVDPSLVGGMRLRVDDTLIDASVETQLLKMRQRLKTFGTNAVQKSAAKILAG